MSIDIEGNGFFRYPEFVCLIQLCVGEDVYLVDPLAIENISVTDFRLLTFLIRVWLRRY